MFLVMVLGVCSSLSATISVFVPGDYASLSEAISWLNTQAISDSYVINVNASYTETVTEPILLTATGSASCSITIQKHGVGANPIITRTDTGTINTTALGGSGDAIIRMDGSDYVNWNGIDVVANESTIEYGYLTHKPSGTDGCQYISIKNCSVTMTKGTSPRVTGIYISNGANAVNLGTGVTVTADSGRNQFISISGVTVQNVQTGIFCRGSSATGFPDSDITIGEAGAPNLIQNFGGGTSSPTYGIYFMYCTNPSASYNTINNAGGGGTSHSSGLYGIYFYTGTSGVLNANYNNITMAQTANSWGINYIYNQYLCTSESYVGNTFSAGLIASTGNVYLIYSSNGTLNKTISNNQITGTITRTGSTGNFFGYCNHGSPASGLETITNNDFSNVVVSGTTMFFGISSYTSTAREQVIANNTISNITGGGEFYGIRYGGVTNIYNNQIYNLSTGGSICAMLQIAGTINNYRNTIYNLISSGSNQIVYGIYIGNGTLTNIYNNMIYGLQAPGYLTVNTPVLRGIHIAAGTANNIHYNTIYLNHHGENAYFSSLGIFFYMGTLSDLRNNIIVNKCVAGTNGYSAALGSNGINPYGIGPNSDKNIYYSENIINSISDFAWYKSLISDRDQNSYWEDVPFVSTTRDVNLHIQPGVPTLVEGNAIPLAGFDSDYDNQDRSNTRPDIGADEGVFTAITDAPEEIVIDDNDGTLLPDGVIVTSGGSMPAELPGVDSGLPVQLYTINATGTWNVTVYKPTAWTTDWYCWIKVGNELYQGSNPIPSQTSSTTFEYVDFGAKGTATVVINDNQTLPVELSSFTAIVTSDLFVTLKWVAESETNHAGYNIYRGESEDLGSSLQLNTQLINNGTANGTQISYVYADCETCSNMHYYYWLESMSLYGISQFFGPISVVIGNHDEPGVPPIPIATKLLNAFPNPINTNTNLRYSLKDAGKVTMEVYNLKGQKIRSYFANHGAPGFYQFTWDSRDMNGKMVPSGIYLYRMTSGTYSNTKRMILAK